MGNHRLLQKTQHFCDCEMQTWNFMLQMSLDLASPRLVTMPSCQ